MMKKFLSLALCLLMLCGMLAGCSGSDGKNGADGDQHVGNDTNGHLSLPPSFSR